MGKKTDNHALNAKCALREKYLPQADPVRVLDLFGGYGVIWNTIKARNDRDIRVLRVEKRKDCGGVYLKGDNRKFIGSIDLDDFDIVDIDAYGIPFEQVSTILDAGFQGIIHVTFIQAAIGAIPIALAEATGVESMRKICPTLIAKLGFPLWCQWLHSRGVQSIQCVYSGLGQSKGDPTRRWYMVIDTRQSI